MVLESSSSGDVGIGEETDVQLTLSDEQLDLRRTVRSFLDKKSTEASVRAAMASTAGWDPQLWQAMADQGLQGLAVPETLGGGGFGYVALAVVAEELGRALAVVPFLATTGLATELLVRSGDSPAAAELLPGILAGTTVATVALFDDGQAVSSRRDGDVWRVSGVTRYVIAGDAADLVLVLAGTDAGPSVFAVDAHAPGVIATPLDTLDQTRRLSDLTFTDALARPVGSPGGGAALLDRARLVATVLLAAEQVGGAQRALELAVDYARTRIQFGRPIGTFQAVKHKCADMLAAVEAERATAQYAAWALEADDPDLEVAVSLAKVKCSEAYNKVAEDTVQIHGGIGFTWEHPAHLYVKRARSDYLLLGTPAEHRRRLAELLDV